MGDKTSPSNIGAGRRRENNAADNTNQIRPYPLRFEPLTSIGFGVAGDCPACSPLPCRAMAP